MVYRVIHRLVVVDVYPKMCLCKDELSSNFFSNFELPPVATAIRASSRCKALILDENWSFASLSVGRPTVVLFNTHYKFGLVDTKSGHK